LNQSRADLGIPDESRLLELGIMSAILSGLVAGERAYGNRHIHR